MNWLHVQQVWSVMEDEVAKRLRDDGYCYLGTQYIPCVRLEAGSYGASATSLEEYVSGVYQVESIAMKIGRRRKNTEIFFETHLPVL